MSLKLFDCKEVKIFLTFFLVYLAFMHWVGWNEESRLALAESIAKYGTFQIDPYANFTGDRAYYEGHYYSDKAPGSSFLATPLLLLSGAGGSNARTEAAAGNSSVFIERQAFLANILEYYELPAGRGTLMAGLVALLSALPGALLVVLIYKTCSIYVKEEKYCLVAAVASGLATLLFPYSTVFMGNVLSTFFAFLGFYLLLNYTKKKDRTNDGTGIDAIGEGWLLPGLLMGFSVVIDYLSVFAFVPAITFFYLKTRKTKPTVYFLLAFLLGVSPLIVYNLSVFSSPFELTLMHLDPTIYFCEYHPDMCNGLLYNILDPSWFVQTVFGVLVLPYRGLFFYYPMTILCLAGVCYLWKEEKALSACVLAIFASLAIAVSFYTAWHGGASFGLRYGVLLVPFLSLPLSKFLEKAWKVRWARLIVLSLLAVSLFINLLGTSAAWEGITLIHTMDQFPPKAHLEWSTGSFLLPYKDVIWLNPLYGNYLPMFLDSGPRSRLFEDFIAGNLATTDIRDFQPMGAREIKLFTMYPFGIIELKVPFLVLTVLSAIVLLIWSKEISYCLKITRTGFAYLAIIVAFIFVAAAFFLEIKAVTFDEGWYPLSFNGTSILSERWMAKEAAVHIYAPQDENSNLALDIGTFFRPRTLEIEINGKTYYRLVSSYNDSHVIANLSLHRGENRINFRSVLGCDRPFEKSNGSEDYRCLSFILHGIRLAPKLPDKDIIYEDGWYFPEGSSYWTTGNFSFAIYSENEKEVKLNLSANSYLKPRKLGFFADGVLLDRIRIENYYTDILTKTIKLNRGFTEIGLYSDSGCEYPSLLENRTDFRCLGFAIANLSLVELDRIDPGKGRLLLGPNWYEKEPDGVWMSENASIFLFSDREKSATIDLNVSSYYRSSGLFVYLNRKMVFYDFVPNRKVELSIPNLTLQMGENLIEIVSKETCEVPGISGGTGDERCLGFKFFDFAVNGEKYPLA